MLPQTDALPAARPRLLVLFYAVAGPAVNCGALEWSAGIARREAEVPAQARAVAVRADGGDRAVAAAPEADPGEARRERTVGTGADRLRDGARRGPYGQPDALGAGEARSPDGEGRSAQDLQPRTAGARAGGRRGEGDGEPERDDEHQR